MLLANCVVGLIAVVSVRIKRQTHDHETGFKFAFTPEQLSIIQAKLVANQIDKKWNASRLLAQTHESQLQVQICFQRLQDITFFWVAYTQGQVKTTLGEIISSKEIATVNKGWRLVIDVTIDSREYAQAVTYLANMEGGQTSPAEQGAYYVSTLSEASHCKLACLWLMVCSEKVSRRQFVMLLVMTIAQC